MAYLQNFLNKFLSSSADISFGRTASFLCLIFCLGWDSASLAFIFWNWKLLHPVIADLWVPAATLAGQGAFCVTFYTVTKAKDAIRPGNGQ